MKEIILVLITFVVGPLLLAAAGWLTMAIGVRMARRPARWGAWTGGGLGVLLMVFLGVVEAAATGAHPVTLLLMAYALIAVVGGIAVGAAAGAVLDGARRRVSPSRE